MTASECEPVILIVWLLCPECSWLGFVWPRLHLVDNKFEGGVWVFCLVCSGFLCCETRPGWPQPAFRVLGSLVFLFSWGWLPNVALTPTCFVVKTALLRLASQCSPGQPWTCYLSFRSAWIIATWGSQPLGVEQPFCRGRISNILHIRLPFRTAKLRSDEVTCGWGSPQHEGGSRKAEDHCSGGSCGSCPQKVSPSQILTCFVGLLVEPSHAVINRRLVRAPSCACPR